MKRTIIAVTALVLALSMSACGDKPSAPADTKPESTSNADKAKVDAEVRTKADADAKADAESKAKAEAEAKAKAEEAKKQEEKSVKEMLKKYMFENYGGNGNEKLKTSWYAYIEDYEVHKSGDKFTVVVKTSLFPKGSNKQIAQNIMNAISSLTDVKLWGVTVKGNDDSPLASK